MIEVQRGECIERPTAYLGAASPLHYFSANEANTAAGTGPRPVFPHGDGFVWFCCFNSFRPKLEKLIPETRRGDHSGRKGGPHQRCVCALASQIGDRQTTVVVVVVYAAGLFSGSLLLFFPPLPLVPPLPFRLPSLTRQAKGLSFDVDVDAAV